MKFNFKRWVVVGFLATLMIFSFAHLSSAGSNYKILTTSDSGFFYGIAREINKTNGYIEKYELSRPPQYTSVSTRDQLQPLMLVMLYRGVYALDPSISMMNVSQYFSPFIFMLALIGVFLAARELGGDLAGGVAAFFLSVMVGSIYWTKFGAFDREITQIFFSAWVSYLFIKLFKAPPNRMIKYGVLTGLVYGLFMISWVGALYLEPIIIGGLILVLLNRIPANKEPRVPVEKAVYSGIRENFRLIISVALLIGIVSVIAIQLGGYAPNFWIGFSKRVGGLFGIGGGGGGGLIFPTVATEQAAPTNYLTRLQHHLYGIGTGGPLLTNITLAFLSLGILKAIWTRKREELLLIPWVLVVGVMATQQSRFYRMWWVMLPIVAGFGSVVLIRLSQRVLSAPEISTSNWVDRIRQPIVLALFVCVFITPYVYNARANATDVIPSPHGGTPGVVYLSLVDAYTWIGENKNTPEDSIVMVEWSYGHLLTGIANRKTVVDGAGGAGGSREEGTWRDQPGFKPPEYIHYVEGNKARIYGIRNSYPDGEVVYIPPRSYQTNGRRVDAQNMPIMDRDEFEWLILAYRENYDIKIDYIVFNWIGFRSAQNYYLNTQPANILLKAKRIKTKLQSPIVEGHIFNFGENREEVILDTQNLGNVYLRTGTKNKYMDGCGVLNVSADGRIQSCGGFYPPLSAPEIPETLLLFTRGGKLVNAWLIEAVSEKIITRPKPMGWRVFTGDVGDIDYLQVAHTSSNDLSIVVKINHIPQPETPIEDVEIGDNTPMLQWSGAIGAAKYEVSVDNNSGFTSPLLKNVTGLSCELTCPLPDGDYYWRIRAFDEDNNATNWSSIQTFTINTSVKK